MVYLSIHSTIFEVLFSHLYAFFILKESITEQTLGFFSSAGYDTSTESYRRILTAAKLTYEERSKEPLSRITPELSIPRWDCRGRGKLGPGPRFSYTYMFCTRKKAIYS